MSLIDILIQMAIIFGVVAVGYFATRIGVWKTDMNRPISVFVLNVTCPMLIIGSVMGEGLVFSSNEVYQLISVAALNYTILIVAAVIISRIWRVNPAARGLQKFMLTFGNVTFIGFPACAAIFGDRAVFYASVLGIPFNLLIFTIGLSFITDQPIRNVFKPRILFSPCVVASVIAVVLALFKVSAPAPVAQFFHLVGDMTIPCALILIGATLSTIPVRDMMGNRFVFGIATFKLVLLPLLVWSLFTCLPFEPLVTQVAVVLTGMPVAANGIMLCLKYGKDEHLMTQVIFMTTFLSLFTIPLIAYALR
ncbi:MAG: AEC family transporter [Bacteroidaceae bacterium]|nr:AEC family transporter [Bacteroidaceae bacterium]